MMIILVLILALMIVVVTLVFAVANGTPVTINLIFAQIPTQLSLAILIPFIAGVVSGLLLMTPGAISSQIKIVSHQRKISSLEKASSASSSAAPSIPAPVSAPPQPKPPSADSEPPTQSS
jgi:uncharacterized membrane protein YciS (DUF1049 family)